MIPIYAFIRASRYESKLYFLKAGFLLFSVSFSREASTGTYVRKIEEEEAKRKTGKL